jgi:hypothetical protein
MRTEVFLHTKFTIYSIHHFIYIYFDLSLLCKVFNCGRIWDRVYCQHSTRSLISLDHIYYIIRHVQSAGPKNLSIGNSPIQFVSLIMCSLIIINYIV